MSGSGISWAICKSAPRCWQITTPAPTTQFFTGRMLFLPPNQQRQCTEGRPLNMCRNSPCPAPRVAMQADDESRVCMLAQNIHDGAVSVITLHHSVQLCERLTFNTVGAPATNLFVKCHLKFHIDITLHYIWHLLTWHSFPRAGPRCLIENFLG